MFKNPNPYDEDVTAATSETLTKENWELISELCEKVEQGGEQGARDCVAAIQKRLLHRIPNVQNYALTLSNSLVQTCGISVHKEISSRAFTQTLTRILQDKSTHDTVKSRILIFIQDWTHQFQKDDSLGLMEETMNNLRSQGFQFPSPEKPKKEISEYELEKQKKEEEEQLQLAMALSLSTERNGSRNTTTTTTTRTTPSVATTPSQPVSHNKELPHTPSVSKVKALYDFAPTESGELGFSRGDVITVLDSVYKDWWRGELHGKTGIFPVNYVEPLPEPTAADIAREAEIEAAVFAEGRNIDQLLEMLAALDPTRDSVTENDTVQNLYNRTLPVRPKLMKLIEKYSQKKDDLIALNKKFTQAVKTYDRLMNESLKKYDAYINPPQHQFQPGYNVPSVPTTYQPDPSAGYFNPQRHFPVFPQSEQLPSQQPPYQAPPQAPPHQAPPQAPPHQAPPHHQATPPPHQAPPHQAPPHHQATPPPQQYPPQQDYQQAQYNQPQAQQDFMGQLNAYQQANQQVNQQYPPAQSLQDSETHQQSSNFSAQLYPPQEQVTPPYQQQPQQAASQTPFVASDNILYTQSMYLKPETAGQSSTNYNTQPPNSNSSYFNDVNNTTSYPPTTDQQPQMQATLSPPSQPPQISLAQISQHLQEYSSSTQQQQQYQPQNSYFNSTDELQVPQGASAPYSTPVAQPTQY